MTDLQIGLGILLALLGGAFASFLGWAEGGEAFDPRKMFCALVRGAIGGISLTWGFILTQTSFNIVVYASIFLVAMGIDLAIVKATHILSGKG